MPALFINLDASIAIALDSRLTCVLIVHGFLVAFEAIKLVVGGVQGMIDVFLVAQCLFSSSPDEQ